MNPSIINVLFALAAGLTAWVSAIFVNRRFATERAALVIRGVMADAHDEMIVMIENVGSRAALAIHLLLDGKPVDYLDGLAAGESRGMCAGRNHAEINIEVVFIDASRHRRRFERRLKGGVAPALVHPSLPGRIRRIAQWFRLIEMS